MIPFLLRYGHWIAIAAAIAAALWYANHLGVQSERQVWKDRQDEITAKLRADLRVADEQSRKDEAAIRELSREREEVVAEFEKTLDFNSNFECISADGLRTLNDTLERLRPQTPQP